MGNMSQTGLNATMQVGRRNIIVTSCPAPEVVGCKIPGHVVYSLNIAVDVVTQGVEKGRRLVGVKM
jgi:hypothetical protein